MAGINFEDFVRSPTVAYHSATYPFISPTRPGLSTKGKTAIITGAGIGGIGNAIALSLAKSGISALGLIGRTEKTLLRTKESAEKLSPSIKVFTYVIDIVDAPAVTSALGSFTKSTGLKIDILAANAGYLPDLNSITDADPEDWWHAFEVNIKGNFNLLRAYIPHAAKDGVVVHTSTSAIHIPYLPGYSGYRGSKIGATKVFETFGHEMAESENGVRTVQFHPGLIKTTLNDRKLGNTLGGIPFDDIELSGDFFNWIVSDEAKFLNGKFVAATWDAEELLQKKAEIAGDRHIYTMNLVGWLEAPVISHLQSG